MHTAKSDFFSVPGKPAKREVGAMSDFSKMRQLFKGVHYYLCFPLIAPIIQGRTLFKGVNYSRKYGTYCQFRGLARFLI